MRIESPMDVLAALARGWRWLLAFGALGLVASILYGFLAPEWYEARLTAVPAEPSTGGVLGQLSDRLPESLVAGRTATANIRRIEAVLTSTSVSDEIIEKFDLRNVYGVSHIEHARKTLWKHCSTSVDRKSDVVTLVCEDTDPARAKSMVDYFGEAGNRVMGRVSASSAKEERRFLETQVAIAKQKIDETSQRLREFREEHKVIDLPEQSKAVISAMASIEGELLSKQLQLSYLTSFSSRNEPGAVQLRQQISILQNKLQQLGSSRKAGDPAAPTEASTSQDGSDFFPDAMQLPELRFELEQLYRDQMIQETAYALLTQRHEMSKVDEARDTSTFQILDHPTLPTIRARPERKKAAVLGLLAGLTLGAMWILLPVLWRSRASQQTPPRQPPEPA